MEGWKDIKLKELLEDIGDGGTPSTIDSTNFGGEIAWAVVEDVLPNIYYTNECLTEKGYTSCSAKKWPKGSIILTTGATIGLVGITHIELCTKQGITGMIPNKYANNYFLRYWFEANIKQLLRYAQGTTFKEIRPRTLSNLKISIPNPFTDKGFDEQKAIATILSKVDEAIETTKQSINASEKLKKAMMQNLLTGKLKPDGTWRKEEDFYIDEKFGKIPNGWNFKKIKDVFDINSNTLSSQTNADFSFNYITIENVSTEVIDFENCVSYKFKDSPGRARRNLKNGDILISGVRPNLKSFAIYENPNNENWICSTGFYVLSAKENQDKEFYFYQILSSIGEKQFYSYVAGSNYPAIGDRDLKNMIVYSPSFDEQIEISKKFKILADTISEKLIKIKSLEKLKKSLMQHLLTGKKRLSNEAIEKFNQI